MLKTYKETIGIEVHAELKTKNKIFSPSLNHYGNMANTSINIIDLGYPGTLPTLNSEVLHLAVRACHVLNLKINRHMHFDRKNYFYPDNPKNFQITQKETPIGSDGYVEITKGNGETKKIYIEEMHIEEDTCKSVHGKTSSLLDFNRAGVPLIEIVTKACISDSEEAYLYLERLRELLLYGDISDCKIEEGSMRCDANISVSDTDRLGTKVEVKNIGSISNVRDAIDYEIKRQSEVLDGGETVIEETRRFDAKQNKTIRMRVKETGNDYRYLCEPDIPYVNLTDEFIEESLNGLSTLPGERIKKYLEAGISSLNANKIIQNKDISDYLERFNKIDLVIASNLLLGDISSYLNKTNKKIDETHLTDDKFLDLVNRLSSGEISNKIFKELLNNLMENDKDIKTLLDEKNLNIVNNHDDIVLLVRNVLANNEKMVLDYKNGNERVIKALMGQVMKESHGSVLPMVANEILLEELRAEN